MNVHEDIALDPGVGAVKIEIVVRGAVEDVVDDLKDGAGPLAAGKIDGVVETPGVAEIVVPEDSVAAGGNAVDAMKALRTRRRRIAWENAVLNDERTAVERNVLHDRRGWPGAVIDKHNGVVYMDLRVVPADRCAAARIEIDVIQMALDRRVDEIDAAPVARCRRVLPDADAPGVGALREKPTGAIDGDRGAGGHIHCGARLDRERNTVRDGEVRADVVRPARWRPGSIAGQCAGDVVYHRARIIPDVDVGPC